VKKKPKSSYISPIKNEKCQNKIFKEYRNKKMNIKSSVVVEQKPRGIEKSIVKIVEEIKDD
jgi:hypothetical protein